LPDQLISTKINHIDQTFRMQHTNGHWIWLRVRCELSSGAGDGGLHLIGIAVDINRAEEASRADRGSRLRYARIETIPKPSCCGTPRTAWCCATRISAAASVAGFRGDAGHLL